MAPILILSPKTEPLAAELEAKLRGLSLEPARIDPAEDAEAAEVEAEASPIVVAIRPARAEDYLAIGRALGAGQKVITLAAAGVAGDRGRVSAASIEEVLGEVEAAAGAPRELDADWFRARGAEEAAAWFEREYPGTWSTGQWTRAAQARALMRGGAHWLRLAFRFGLIRLFPMDGEDLSSASLAGADLRALDLGGAILSAADLRGAQLSRVRLRGAKLDGANLEGASLEGTDLRDAVLSAASFRYAGLASAQLAGATVANTDFFAADLSEAGLAGLDLRSAKLSRARLAGTDLRGANLEGCDLSGLVAVRALFTGAKLRGASLARANLDGAELSDIDYDAHTNFGVAGLRRSRREDRSP